MEMYKESSCECKVIWKIGFLSTWRHRNSCQVIEENNDGVIYLLMAILWSHIQKPLWKWQHLKRLVLKILITATLKAWWTSCNFYSATDIVFIFYDNYPRCLKIFSRYPRASTNKQNELAIFLRTWIIIFVVN